MLAIAMPAAADTYPDKPIKIIVPAAARGPSDLPARLASQILPAGLGQPVIIENRPGAGGAIGAGAAAGAPADDHTLFRAAANRLAQRRHGDRAPSGARVLFQRQRRRRAGDSVPAGYDEIIDRVRGEF